MYIINIIQKENGYIEIELIDNPFSDRPNDLAFNGWVTDYQGAEISYDSDYYKRYVRVPVGNATEIEIHMYASWTNATVAYAGGELLLMKHKINY